MQSLYNGKIYVTDKSSFYILGEDKAFHSLNSGHFKSNKKVYDFQGCDITDEVEVEMLESFKKFILDNVLYEYILQEDILERIIY